jgi:hypothetical protein
MMYPPYHEQQHRAPTGQQKPPPPPMTGGAPYGHPHPLKRRSSFGSSSSLSSLKNHQRSSSSSSSSKAATTSSSAAADYANGNFGNSSKSRKALAKAWTKAEDDHLLDLVLQMQHPLKWSVIAQSMSEFAASGGAEDDSLIRSGKQCRERVSRCGEIVFFSATDPDPTAPP